MMKHGDLSVHQLDFLISLSLLSSGLLFLRSLIHAPKKSNDAKIRLPQPLQALDRDKFAIYLIAPASNGIGLSVSPYIHTLRRTFRTARLALTSSLLKAAEGGHRVFRGLDGRVASLHGADVLAVIGATSGGLGGWGRGGGRGQWAGGGGQVRVEGVGPVRAW